MIVTIQTLNGIAIAVESPHQARPAETPNIVPLNQYTVVAYHESMALGQQMVEGILQKQVDPAGHVFSVAEQATALFNEFVTRDSIRDPIGFLFLGYASDGQGAMLGWFHAGDQARRTRFFPYCTSRTCTTIGYLLNKLYTPDLSLAKALELAAYAVTQSWVVLAGTPVMTYERVNLAAIHPDHGFFWLDQGTTESIIRKNEERDRALRIACADLFVDGV
jgi:hypothetical protein